MEKRNKLFELQPLDHVAGLGTFILVPFYSFQDFVFKDPVVFYEGEVTSIECDPESKKPLRINYCKDGFEGSVDIRNRYADFKFESIPVEYSKRDNRKLFREFFHCFFTWHNPSFLTHIFLVILTIILFNVGKQTHFWTINNAPFEGCDKGCIDTAYNIVFASIMNAVMRIVLPLIAFVYFYFFHFKKIKHGGRASFVRFNGGLFLIMAIIGFNELTANWQEESTLKAFEISYSKHNLPGRNIASVLKENSFVKKTEEPKKFSKPVQKDLL